MLLLVISCEEEARLTDGGLEDAEELVINEFDSQEPGGNPWFKKVFGEADSSEAELGMPLGC